MGTFGYTSPNAAGTMVVNDSYGLYVISPSDADGTSITSMNVYTRDNVGAGGTIKAFVCDADGYVLGVSDVYTFTDDVQEWKSIPFSTPVSISADTYYYLCSITASTNISWLARDTNTNINMRDGSNSYASPQRHQGTTDIDYSLAIEAVYEAAASGPGYTIEGQTPDKINTLPWADVGSIT